jgi:hypothetical protein
MSIHALFQLADILALFFCGFAVGYGIARDAERKRSAGRSNGSTP